MQRSSKDKAHTDLAEFTHHSSESNLVQDDMDGVRCISSSLIHASSTHNGESQRVELTLFRYLEYKSRSSPMASSSVVLSIIPWSTGHHFDISSILGRKSRKARFTYRNLRFSNALFLMIQFIIEFEFLGLRLKNSM
ncbi:hypothetical protein V6N12_036385 [Hibiscus sabdariffa]|uniref:Uncharacterized protein n=1 Tax=Hibiscus sabdariffa TaxID=183260 RepID=A0ABR2ET18_9ROSI